MLPLTGASRPTWPTCPSTFEYQADGIGSTDAIKGTYLDNYKNMFDLYINNSTCAPTELAGKTGDDSRNEFPGQ